MSSSKNHNSQSGGFLFDLNSCSKNNDIFLKAYRKGKYESMKFMLDNNMVTDFAHGDRYGNTILHYAVVNEDEEFILYLLDHIKNNKNIINKGNKKGDTPLHVATRKGLTEIADLLIEKGACPKKKNNEGYYVQKRNIGDKYDDDNDDSYIVPSSNMNFKDVAVGNIKDFLSSLTKRIDNQEDPLEIHVSPVSPMDIFISDTSVSNPRSPRSPIRQLSPGNRASSKKIKNNDIETVSVKDTEDLFKLLSKFNLISNDEMDVDQLGGAKTNKISGTRKIFSTLKGGKRKSKGSKTKKSKSKSKSKSKRSKSKSKSKKRSKQRGGSCGRQHSKSKSKKKGRKKSKVKKRSKSKSKSNGKRSKSKSKSNGKRKKKR